MQIICVYNLLFFDTGHNGFQLGGILSLREIQECLCGLVTRSSINIAAGNKRVSEFQFWVNYRSFTGKWG